MIDIEARMNGKDEFTVEFSNETFIDILGVLTVDGTSPRTSTCPTKDK